MSQRKNQGAPGSLPAVTTILIYGLLIMGLATYVMPAISITLPALGKKMWSVHSVTRIIPKDALPKQKDETDYDFREMLEKLLPKDRKSGELKKVSPEVILAILIPVALAVTYILFLLNFILVPFRNRFCVWVSFVCLLSAGYVLCATKAVNFFVKKNIEDKINSVDKGFLSMLTKPFLEDSSIQPEAAFYWLPVLSFLVLCLVLFRSLRK